MTIKDIFSPATLDVLWVLCKAPYEEFYVREIAREAEVSAAHSSRIMHKLKDKHIVKKRKSGNQNFYQLKLDHSLAKKIFELFSLERKLNLPPKFRAALEEFVRKLKENLHEELISVVLFGSVAQDKARKESDLDILVITEDVEKTKKIVKNLFSEISGFYDKLIEDHIYDKQGFDEAYQEGNDLIINILKDGLILHDRDFYVPYLKKPLPSPSEKYILRTLNFARENLKRGEELISKDSPSAIIYLRMVIRDAGRALLLTKGEIPRSRHQLGKQVGRTHPEYGKLIRKINKEYEQHMQEGKEISKEALLKYLEKAEKFLKEAVEMFENA